MKLFSYRGIVPGFVKPFIRQAGTNLLFLAACSVWAMSQSQNPMAYLLEFGLRKVEKERPELANDEKYQGLKARLLQDAEGHFREIQATYATVLQTRCQCGGQLEPVDHQFGKSGNTVYDAVIAKCKSCGTTQSFQFPKQGFLSEARSALALRDYLQGTYGIDYTTIVMDDMRNRPVSTA